MNFVLMLATVVVMGPCGEKVCEVTPPTAPDQAVVETTNFAGTVAWRFRFDGTGPRTLKQEELLFDFGSDFRCWPVAHAQAEYVSRTLDTIEKTSDGPLVVEGANFVAALGEAGNLGHARLRFARGPRRGTVRAFLENPATVQAPCTTPWRYIHTAKDAVALANAQPAVMDALNAPSRVADTSWIKPGKVIRVARLTTKDGKDCVDFVKRNGLQYIEIDAGWYGPEQKGNPLKPVIDPRRAVKGESFDLQAILAYAREQNVGVILYVNAIPLEKNLEAILDQLVAWGVKGVKYGFVRVGRQRDRQWVHKAIKAAAARRLMVDIHDEYRLTGIQRTYPHVMTVEGIRGNEEMPVARHNAALAFTRFLDGPGDYTPCWIYPRIKNTLAHQLALPAVYTSGWQFLYWYSVPSQIDASNPALDFWRELPAAFDETRYLQGTIGDTVVVARRKGTTWYLGALNAGEPRTISVPLAFAGPGSFKVRLFRDADPANAKPCAPVAVETMTVDTLSVPCASNGGFAAIITR